MSEFGTNIPLHRDPFVRRKRYQGMEAHSNNHLSSHFRVQPLPQNLKQHQPPQRVVELRCVEREHRLVSSKWLLFCLDLFCPPSPRAQSYRLAPVPSQGRRRASGSSRTALVAFLTLVLPIAPLYAADCSDTSVKPVRDANSAPPQKRIVALTVASLQVDFLIQIKESAEAEAKAKGVNLIVADANGDLSVQIKQIQDIIRRGVNAVICIPIDPESVGNELKAAREANIYVVNVGRASQDAPGDTFIATDEVGAANILGEYVCKLTDGKANIGIIEGPPGSKSQADRDKGFNEAIADCPGLRIVAKQFSREWTQVEGLNIAQVMLVLAPDINAFLGQNDLLALGAAHAVKSAYIQHKLWIFGFDGDGDGLQAVRDGTLDATVTQKTQYIGKLAIDSALGLIDGKHLPKEQLQEAVLTTKQNVGLLLRLHP
jgi:ribose transport system substrate-binding protein